mmetsp:Transcript_37284/g.97756  ORF Transcript_37284/g.97756 Transcript_37284/m.97756 type:complete len:249 (-) Transcript_37284:1377-2123(-)
MVAFGHMKFGLLLVRKGLLFFGAVEDRLHRQHRHNRQDLVRAPQVGRLDHHLGLVRFKRELGHPPPKPSEQSFVVERAEREERLKGKYHCLGRRGVHKVKRNQVIDPHCLKLEQRGGQVGPLNLWDCGVQHLIPERPLSVQAVALARPCPAGPATPLLGLLLRDRRHHQRVHPRLGVVHLLLDKAGVNHVVDAVDRERRLGNVGRNHHLPRARLCGLEDPRLHLRRQCRVDGQNDQLGDIPERLHPLV